MKSLFPILLSIILFPGLFLLAQQEDLEEIPFPVGGIEEIANNIVYPQYAKENKIEGEVIIKAFFDEKGNILSTEVVKSLNAECDNAAAAAIKKTKFKPGKKNGEAIESAVTIPVMFKLK